ncbi:hypothetical protein O9X90_25135 [Agrobacterium leguminum]|uniref:hypothetical protein n=1 Tax=Agrobacterium TaxID=357 RepID=UPI001574AA1B|nr:MULTISPECIES: hypothetical protein [Agrobacterium]MCZ7935615.1 hypothetical protein [Agrobacterium leguminum]NTA35534.1 hypothetical protein [Agrobacterium salinitolerans]
MASDQVMTTAFVLMIARFPFSRFWPSSHHRGSLKRGLTLHSTRDAKILWEHFRSGFELPFMA